VLLLQFARHLRRSGAPIPARAGATVRRAIPRHVQEIPPRRKVGSLGDRQLWSSLPGPI